MRPLRILLVNKAYPPHIGGIETLVRRYACCLQARPDATVKVLVCQEKGKTAQEVVEGIPVMRSGSLGTYFSCPLSVSFLRHFRRMAEWADVIMVHMPFPLADLACLLSGYHGRLVLAWHSDVVKQKTLLRFYRPLLRWMLQRADCILTATQGHIESSAFLPAVREKCRVIPYGIDIAAYRAAPAYPVLSRSANRTDTVKVLFVGRLVYYKGVSVLLEAMQQVHGCELFLVGSGKLEATLRQTAAKQNTVHFLGNLSDADLRAALQECDFLVLPSVANSEAFGLVQLEAMVYGKPVINTALPTGVPHVSVHGETGLTVPPQDVQALADAIQKLTSDADLRQAYGVAAKKRTETVFAEETIMQQVYDSLRDGIRLDNEQSTKQKNLRKN
jgi:rhamnosyl/mannosyltransferase